MLVCKGGLYLERYAALHFRHTHDLLSEALPVIMTDDGTPSEIVGSTVTTSTNNGIAHNRG